MTLDNTIPVDYGIIYCATNKVNNKKYIGQTIHTLNRRRQFHMYDAFKRNLANCFCRALRKYGKGLFEWYILMPAMNQDHLNLLEDYWIRVFNTLAPNGYNLKTGGSHGRPADITKQLIRKTVKKLWQNPEYAKAMSDAHKKPCPKTKRSMKRLWQNPEYAEMMSKAHLGYKCTKETKRKMRENNKGERNPFYGKHHTIGIKLKISKANKDNKYTLGYKHSPKMKQKRREAQKILWQNYEYRLKMSKAHSKLVVCVETNEIYKSIKDAKKETGADHISAVANGKRKTAGGFHWQFVMEGLHA